MRSLFRIATVAVATAGISIGLSASGFAADIVTTAVGAGQFKTLAAALGAADLVPTLQGPGPFTVFAPTDEAFAKLPEGTVASLLLPENKSKLVKILTYHVVPGNVSLKQAVKLDGATTVNGQRVDIAAGIEGVSVDAAKIVAADIECDNGVIHIIDSVMLPEALTIPEKATQAGTFNTLLAAVGAAGLAETLGGAGPFTVFAPTDEAFAKLPAGTVESLLEPENKSKLVDILKYHVVSGVVYSEAALSAKTAKTLNGSSVSIGVRNGKALVNEASLVALDIDAANGVIHVIDAVLLPPSTSQASSMTPAGAVNVSHMLTTAISQGVPVYNAGDHHGCAMIYENALDSCMSMPMESQLHHHVQSVLSSARRQHSSTDRAWTMRRGIDQLLTQLHGK